MGSQRYGSDHVGSDAVHALRQFPIFCDDQNRPIWRQVLTPEDDCVIRGEATTREDHRRAACMSPMTTSQPGYGIGFLYSVPDDDHVDRLLGSKIMHLSL